MSVEVRRERLIEKVFDHDVIMVGTGIHNSLGNGFQHDVKINFPDVEKKVKSRSYGDPRKLGLVDVVDYGTIVFCVCYIHRGAYRRDVKPDYLDYEALQDCIDIVASHFKGKKVASTVIGGGPFDGGGDRNRIMKMLEDSGMDITVYDYEEEDYRAENNRKWKRITDLVGKIPYDELRRLKDEYRKERKYGIYYNKHTENGIKEETGDR